jgi:hypothetical protein
MTKITLYGVEFRRSKSSNWEAVINIKSPFRYEFETLGYQKHRPKIENSALFSSPSLALAWATKNINNKFEINFFKYE